MTVVEEQSKKGLHFGAKVCYTPQFPRFFVETIKRKGLRMKTVRVQQAIGRNRQIARPLPGTSGNVNASFLIENTRHETNALR
jgi:hypothetical protein